MVRSIWCVSLLLKIPEGNPFEVPLLGLPMEELLQRLPIDGLINGGYLVYPLIGNPLEVPLLKRILLIGCIWCISFLVRIP